MTEFSDVTLRLCRAQVDYTTRQLGVLVRLSQIGDAKEPRLYKALAQDLVMSKAALTRSINRLEKDGWVSRDYLPGDKRQYWVALTDAGSAWLVENGLVTPAPAWWVLTIRATDAPFMVGPFDSAAKAARWGDAARNYAGASAARRVVQTAGTINPLSPDEGTKRAKAWAQSDSAAA